MTAGDEDATLHVTDDLPGLFLGELTGAETARVRGHLSSCELCRDELVSMALASGALVGAARHIGGATEESSGAPGWDEKPSSVRRDTPRRNRQPPGGHHALVRAGGMVLAVLLGLASGFLLSRTAFAAHGPTGPVVASGRLRGVDAPAAAGAAEVLAAGPARVVHVRAEHLPALRPGQFYEVWLLDPRTDKMLPLGVLPPSGRAAFAIPAALTQGYSALNVSLQKDNGDPAHSATSELQGPITPAR